MKGVGHAWRREKGLDGGVDGVEMRFGWTSRVGPAVRGFCGSQGWTVPGGSVPVCGSVRGLPESLLLQRL